MDDSSNMETSNRALRVIGAAAGFAMLGALAGFARMTWDWWSGTESPLWLFKWTMTLTAAGMVAELVASFWQRHRGFALLTVATAALFYVALQKTLAAGLAELIHQWTGPSPSSWALACFGMAWVWLTGFVGVLEAESCRRRNR